MNTTNIPRIVLAAPASGSGKTMITCGLLQILKKKGLQVQAYKCGPDYIDPMFHKVVLDTPSKNLDLYLASNMNHKHELSEREKISKTSSKNNFFRYLFARAAEQKDIAVIEGVMGYFDGLGGTTSEASTAEVAENLDAPVILIVNAKGMSVSLLPLIQGFLTYEQKSDHHTHLSNINHSKIKGVILNRMSPMIYPRMKSMIEETFPVKVLGFVPEMKDFTMESRHLGLKMPQEIVDIRESMEQLGARLEETLDVEEILNLAHTTNPINYEPITYPKVADHIRIGVARDEAFCFYYEDNLSLLEEMGAELIYFSPIHDKQLPEHIQGLLIGGGYPELYATELEQNETMRNAIRQAIQQDQLPYLAECGGFMYLQTSFKNADGKIYQMVDAIKGTSEYTGKLKRFGYMEMKAEKDQIYGKKGDTIRAHEFHYFDSTDNGEDFIATKPVNHRTYSCIRADQQGAAGYAHLYYYSNSDFPRHFLERCKDFR